MQNGETAFDVAGTDEIRALLSPQPTAPKPAADESSRTCVVCLSEPREVLLMPCRMLVLCRACAQRIGPAGSPGTKCPVCRAGVRKMIAVYTP